MNIVLYVLYIALLFSKKIMLIAKLLKSVKHELMEEEIFLFEKDENVLFCRGQNLCPQQSQEFSSFRRRHHCRHCGGVSSIHWNR